MTATVTYLADYQRTREWCVFYREPVKVWGIWTDTVDRYLFLSAPSEEAARRKALTLIPLGAEIEDCTPRFEPERA